jgi:hypothetical protein
VVRHQLKTAAIFMHSDRMVAAVTGARIAAHEDNGAVFAPLAMGGTGGLRARLDNTITLTLSCLSGTAYSGRTERINVNGEKNPPRKPPFTRRLIGIVKSMNPV